MERLIFSSSDGVFAKGKNNDPIAGHSTRLTTNIPSNGLVGSNVARSVGMVVLFGIIGVIKNNIVYLYISKL